MVLRLERSAGCASLPIAITPEQVRRFNAPVVLLQDGLRQTYTGGEAARAAITLSITGKASAPGRVTCTLVRDDQILTRAFWKSRPSPTAPSSRSARWSLSCPRWPNRSASPSRPTSRRRNAPLNDWTLWVYPDFRSPATQQTPVYASPTPWPCSRRFGRCPRRMAQPSPRRPYVARQPSEDLVTAAEQEAAWSCCRRRASSHGLHHLQVRLVARRI